MKSLLKQGLVTAISMATRRSAVLLASEAAHDNMLSLVAPYRVAGQMLTIQLLEPTPGEMHVRFTGIREDGTEARSRFEYAGPGPLALDLRDGALSFAGRALGSISGGQPVSARRFGAAFELFDTRGGTRRRVTSHYQPRDGQEVDRSYFAGEDYADYEAESASVHHEVLDLAHRHRVQGPVLEIGCATGGTLEALRRADFDACGLDISPWAIEQTRARVGNVAWQCDVDRDPLPAEVVARGPFGCFVLASVLEHFAHPRDVLAKLGTIARPGASLIVLTTNGDSLTHRIFGGEWEGYFDWTHKSVDEVTPRALRQWLAELRWSIRELRTWHVWDSCADPTHATLRDWHASDARFRRLLAERELGDFIACVAVRT